MSDYITAEEVLAKAKQMSVREQARLKDMLYAENEKRDNLDDSLLQHRFPNGVFCPRCGKIHIRKNGHKKDGTQRFLCMECGRTFTLRTNTIFEGTRKGAGTWRKFLKCMTDHKSLDKCAEECGITHYTAFTWRHKVLDALAKEADSTLLSGVVESDDTFFAVSYKGNAKHFQANSERPARTRGYQIHKRGLSDELVCVPCAVDAKGNSAAKIAKLGKCSTKSLQSVLDGRIEEGSTLCSDGDSSYKAFAKSNALKLVQIIGGRRSKRGLSIQRINGYHSSLKTFIRNFKGVSTKYLNNYLVWNDALEYCKAYTENKITLLLESAAKVLLAIRSVDVASRSELPILA